jgi:hypothetical protein
VTEYIKHPHTGRTMRTPLILGMDPGEEKGYAVVDPEDMRNRQSFDAPRVLAMGTTLGEVVNQLDNYQMRRPWWCMVEFQYVARVQTGEISADSIVKLAFRAGAMLLEASCLLGAQDWFTTTPQRWKSEVYAQGGSLRKDVFVNRLIRDLMPDERKRLQEIEEVHEKYVDDVVDSIGVAWALWHAATTSPSRWWSWHCDPEHIIPINLKINRRKRFQQAVVSEARRGTLFQVGNKNGRKKEV